MEDFEQNDFYLTRKNWARLRGPLITQLYRYLRESSPRTIFSAWSGFENNVSMVLSACDPNLGIWDPMLLEYAAIQEIEPHIAYRELDLKISNVNNIKFRAFAWGEKIMQEINQVYDEDDAKRMEYRLESKFDKDSNL